MHTVTGRSPLRKDCGDCATQLSSRDRMSLILPRSFIFSSLVDRNACNKSAAEISHEDVLLAALFDQAIS